MLHFLVRGGGNFAAAEFTAMYGRDAEQFIALLGEANQSSADGLANTCGNSTGHRSNCAARTLIDEDLDQFDGKQWVAVGLLIDHLDRRLRQADLAQSCRDLADGHLRKACKMQALTLGIATQIRERTLQRRLTGC